MKLPTTPLLSTVALELEHFPCLSCSTSNSFGFKERFHSSIKGVQLNSQLLHKKHSHIQAGKPPPPHPPPTNPHAHTHTHIWFSWDLNQGPALNAIKAFSAFPLWK